MPGYPHQPTKAGRAASKKQPDTLSVKPRKPTQRERLLAAMTQLASQQGYAETSIADLTSRAGVSRQTFYECFAGKEDCFLAAYRLCARRVLGQLQHAMSSSEWWERPRAAVRAILAQIAEEPETTWLFWIESLAGGPRIGAERERMLEAFESMTEDFLDHAPAGGETLDVPPQALLGAIRMAPIRSIASRQPRIDAVTALQELGEDMLAWIRSYAVPAGQKRWSAGPHALLPLRSTPPLNPPASRTRSRPEPLPRGRHGLPRAVVVRNHRERIVLATADAIQAKGYAALTVGDIVLAAGIGKDVFYEHFSDKHHVFLAAQQHDAQETFNACAHAYFSYPSWPERVYRALRTLTQIIAAEPALANLRIVAPYSAGPEAIERTRQMTATFAAFLEEGYGYRTEAKRLPYFCSSAIIDAVFEIIRTQIAAGHAVDLPRHMPQLAYIAIAPFTGPQAAGELVERFG